MQDHNGETEQAEIIHIADVLTPQERAKVRAAARKSWPLRSCGLHHTGPCPVEDYYPRVAVADPRMTMASCDPAVVMDVIGR